MVDWTKPLQHVTGMKVRVICTDRQSLDGYTHLVLLDRGGYEVVRHVRSTGFMADGSAIVNAPDKWWYAVLKRGEKYQYSSVPFVSNVYANESDFQAMLGRMKASDISVLEIHSIPKSEVL